MLVLFWPLLVIRQKVISHSGLTCLNWWSDYVTSKASSSPYSYSTIQMYITYCATPQLCGKFIIVGKLTKQKFWWMVWFLSTFSNRARVSPSVLTSHSCLLPIPGLVPSVTPSLAQPGRHIRPFQGANLVEMPSYYYEGPKMLIDFKPFLRFGQIYIPQTQTVIF